MPIKKKKQSRLAKLGAKLKTPKGSIVATVLIFAVVGGGIFVYKSFAATAVWGYTAANGTLVQHGAPNGSCGQRQLRDPQFNTIIHQMNCGKTGGTAAVVTRGASLSGSPWLNKNYRFCAYVKGVGKVNISARDISANGGLMTTSTHSVNNASSYSYRCTYWYKKTKSGFMEGMVNISGHDGSGPFINVGSVVLEKQ